MKKVALICAAFFCAFGFAQSVEEIDVSDWHFDGPLMEKQSPAVSQSFTEQLMSEQDLVSKDAYNNSRRGTTWCATDTVWEMRRNKMGLGPYGKMACPTQGQCDTPAVRDATSTASKTINIYVHLMRNSNGSGGININQARAGYNQMLADYAGTGINFNLVGAQWVNNSTYANIPAYSPFNNNWYNTIQNMKQDYAIYPQYVCNIFVSAQQSSAFGTLLGIATFPWDPAADTKAGGLWMNNIALAGGLHTFAHELGHCFGLWHTHHGVSEVASCSNCYEYASGFEGDIRGDFCSDTPPTPTNYSCNPPGGNDCQGTPWGATQVSNFMGYSSDVCQNQFTPQQTSRIHCWVPDALPNWVQ